MLQDLVGERIVRRCEAEGWRAVMQEVEQPTDSLHLGEFIFSAIRAAAFLTLLRLSSAFKLRLFAGEFLDKLCARQVATDELSDEGVDVADCRGRHFAKPVIAEAFNRICKKQDLRDNGAAS